MNTKEVQLINSNDHSSSVNDLIIIVIFNNHETLYINFNSYIYFQHFFLNSYET